MQSKRKAFNVAEARIADTGAAQFFDARKGLPKAEAAALPSKRTARWGLQLQCIMGFDSIVLVLHVQL